MWLVVVVLAKPHARAASDLHPSWRILALVYETTDFAYQDATGVQHRVVGGLSDAEMAQAESILRQFVEADVPALTSGNMIPSLTVTTPPESTQYPLATGGAQLVAGIG